MPHDISQRACKLPKWAQALMRNMQAETLQLQRENAQLKEVHGILAGRHGWFAIHGPPDRSICNGVYRLYFLDCDGAHAACSLGVGDVLLVGRADTGER